MSDDATEGIRVDFRDKYRGRIIVIISLAACGFCVGSWGISKEWGSLLPCR